jgi:hypothetical protein
MIYAFTGDLNPIIETKTKQIGFKNTFFTFRRDQINEILKDIEKRNADLQNFFFFTEDPPSLLLD